MSEGPASGTGKRRAAQPVHEAGNTTARIGRPQRLRVIAILSGGVALIVIGFATMLLAAGTGVSSNLLFLVSALAWVIAAYNGAFHAHITRDESRIVLLAALASLAAASVVAGFSLALGLFAPRLSELGTAAVSSAVALVLGFYGSRFVLQRLWEHGQFRSRAIVVGSGKLTKELALELAHRPNLGIDVVEHVIAAPAADGDDSSPCFNDALATALQRHAPDRLIVGQLDVDDDGLLPALRLAGTMGTRVYVLPRLFSMGLGNSLFAPDQLRGFPLQRVNRCAHPGLALSSKRAIDIAFSATALLLALPVLVVAAIAVKATSPGELLFWQERVGRSGELIRIPKFRSMRSSDTSDFEWTADDRTTPVGRFLRRSAIDEIPQLWSVLRGDMSLVGPRPERPAFVTQFAAEHEDYGSRHRMRAGLTGLSQIAGLRGDTSIAERAKFDNLYIDQWSLVGDFMIMFRTVGAIIGERSRFEAQRDFEQALLSIDDAAAPPVIDARIRHTTDLQPAGRTGNV